MTVLVKKFPFSSSHTGVLTKQHFLLSICTILFVNRSIWVEIKLKKDTFLIGCVYKCPGSSGSNNEQLNELISEVMRYKHSHFLLLGDFDYPNIDWQNWYTLLENTNSPDTKFK